MTYSVKEIFFTLQGEGANTGRPAVFLRFAGCNLWTGREEDRSKAVCRFCDTDFFGTDGDGGGKFDTAEQLAQAVKQAWPPDLAAPFVVCTGGEPMLQLDEILIEALHREGFEVAVESNGTIAAVPGIDWLCISPKADATLVQRTGHELKLVYPQQRGEPERYAHLDFRHHFLQPMDGPDLIRNTELAERYCLEHPQWKLSLQMHKLVGLR